MNLQNKTIIITGASSGIGAAAAILFSDNGANVVLGARRQNELESLAKKINDGNNNIFTIIPHRTVRRAALNIPVTV